LRERVIKWLTGEPYGYKELDNVIEKHLKEAIIAVENIGHRNTIIGRIQLLVGNVCVRKTTKITDNGVEKTVYEFTGLGPDTVEEPIIVASQQVQQVQQVQQIQQQVQQQPKTIERPTLTTEELERESDGILSKYLD